MIFMIVVWNHFFNSIWLSCHCGFVSNNVMTLNNQTVNRNNLSSLDQLNISNQHIVNGDVFDLPVSNDINIFSLSNLIEFSELLLFNVVVSRSYSNNNYHSSQDRSSFHPSMFQTLCSYSEN